MNTLYNGKPVDLPTAIAEMKRILLKAGKKGIKKQAVWDTLKDKGLDPGPASMGRGKITVAAGARVFGSHGEEVYVHRSYVEETMEQREDRGPLPVQQVTLTLEDGEVSATDPSIQSTFKHVSQVTITFAPPKRGTGSK